MVWSMDSISWNLRNFSVLTSVLNRAQAILSSFIGWLIGWIDTFKTVMTLISPISSFVSAWLVTFVFASVFWMNEWLHTTLTPWWPKIFGTLAFHGLEINQCLCDTFTLTPSRPSTHSPLFWHSNSLSHWCLQYSSTLM